MNIFSGALADKNCSHVDALSTDSQRSTQIYSLLNFTCAKVSAGFQKTFESSVKKKHGELRSDDVSFTKLLTGFRVRLNHLLNA